MPYYQISNSILCHHWVQVVMEADSEAEALAKVSKFVYVTQFEDQYDPNENVDFVSSLDECKEISLASNPNGYDIHEVDEDGAEIDLEENR
jgi:hypothetical protein